MLLTCLFLSVLPFCVSDTVRFDDGTFYTGQLCDSLFNGQGTCVYSDGTVYEGGWKDGCWEGSGTVRYPDGDVYIGQFHDNMKEGHGTYLYHDGARYDGEWKNDMFNGTGRLIFSDGGKYEGAWKDDLKHGFGTLTQAKDKGVWSGYFYNDEYLGRPTDTYLKKDMPLTDELKEWGFKTDPTELYDDSGILSFMISYGNTGMLGVSMLLDFSDRIYGGITIGGNVNPPTWGKRFEYASWNSNNVHQEGEYPFRMWNADLGFKIKSFAVGGSAGIGMTTKYQNCRVTEETEATRQCGLEIEDIYYRTRQGDYCFTWRAYARYTFIKKAVPLAYFCVGYGNFDGLYASLGVYVKF